MSVSETPEDPFVLDIVSVTFGPADCTDYTRRKFNDAWAQDPGIKIWSFQGGLAFFPSDPMPTFIKATVTVYRNTIPNPDGSVSWSNFKSVVVDETKPTVVITFDGVNDTAWISPPLSDYGQYIVWAYWHTTDVTKGVQHQYASLESPANNGVNIAVDQDSLKVNDPLPGKDKQCCITYGNWIYPGMWSFHVVVGMQPLWTWNLVIPAVFPPLKAAQSHGSAYYVKYRNENNDADLYPRVYAGSGGKLIWDGQVSGFNVPKGSTKTVNLMQVAGCQERTPYFLAFASADGTQIWGNRLSTIYATSSSLGTPTTLYWRISNNVVDTGFDNGNVGPPDYSLKDLRLNIYSATWGNKDYTDFMREQYITSTITNPPSDKANIWNLTASFSRFGVKSDPDFGMQKVFVIVYRVAYKIGETNGKINSPKQPPPGDPDYVAETVQSVFSNEYPVCEDVSAFHFQAVHMNGQMTFDLSKEDLRPLSWPLPISVNQTPLYVPFIAKAVWVTTDVTTFTQNTVTSNWGAHGISVTTVPVTITGMGGGTDPWPTYDYKPLTILVGYNVQRQSNSYQWQLLAARNISPGNWTIDVNGALGKPMAQCPSMVISYHEPVYNSITFRNTTTLTCWPQVVGDGGKVIWDGKAQANPNSWEITPNQDRSLRLIDDLKLADGASYSLTFSCSAQTWIPFTGWIVASGMAPQYTMTLTYLLNSNVSAGGHYQVLREISYAG